MDKGIDAGLSMHKVIKIVEAWEVSIVTGDVDDENNGGVNVVSGDEQQLKLEELWFVPSCMI